jgi:hypothetical protein
MSPIVKITDLPRETVVELCTDFMETILAHYDRAKGEVIASREDMSGRSRGGSRC